MTSLDVLIWTMVLLVTGIVFLVLWFGPKGPGGKGKNDNP